MSRAACWQRPAHEPDAPVTIGACTPVGVLLPWTGSDSGRLLSPTSVTGPPSTRSLSICRGPLPRSRAVMAKGGPWPHGAGGSLWQECHWLGTELPQTPTPRTCPEPRHPPAPSARALSEISLKTQPLLRVPTLPAGTRACPRFCPRPLSLRCLDSVFLSRGSLASPAVRLGLPGHVPCGVCPVPGRRGVPPWQRTRNIIVRTQARGEQCGTRRAIVLLLHGCVVHLCYSRKPTCAQPRTCSLQVLSLITKPAAGKTLPGSGLSFPLCSSIGFLSH